LGTGTSKTRLSISGDKTIFATGTVKDVQEVPRIEIDDAGQIRIVDGN
jgi:hypothetical protein